MADSKFQSLDEEETILARVLLKNGLITEEALGHYSKFRKMHDATGKTYLGEILVNLGYITGADKEEFISDNNKLHLKFCDMLAEKGFLTKKQKEMIYENHRESGKDVISLLDHLNIMTRDAFSRIYNKFEGVGILRLGEWLVLKGKVTQQQIERAIDLQKINGLAEFMVFNGYCSEKVMKKVLNKLSGVSLKIKNPSNIKRPL